MQLRIVPNCYLGISKDKHSGTNCGSGWERQFVTHIPCMEHEVSWHTHTVEISWKEGRALSSEKLRDRKEGGGLISISAGFSPQIPCRNEIAWLVQGYPLSIHATAFIPPFPCDVLVLQPWLHHRGVNLLSLPTSLNTTHKCDCLLAFITRAVALLEKIHLAPILWSFQREL